MSTATDGLKVQCACGVSFTLKPVPVKAAKIKCPKCGAMNDVKPPETVAASESPTENIKKPASSPGQKPDPQVKAAAQKSGEIKAHKSSSDSSASGIREIKWYISRHDDKVGPLTSKQLKLLAEAGELKPGEMLQRQGDTKWVPAASVKGLFDGKKSSSDSSASSFSFEGGGGEEADDGKDSKATVKIKNKSKKSSAWPKIVFALVLLGLLGGGGFFAYTKYIKEDESKVALGKGNKKDENPKPETPPENENKGSNDTKGNKGTKGTPPKVVEPPQKGPENTKPEPKTPEPPMKGEPKMPPEKTPQKPPEKTPQKPPEKKPPEKPPEIPPEPPMKKGPPPSIDIKMPDVKATIPSDAWDTVITRKGKFIAEMPGEPKEFGTSSDGQEWTHFKVELAQKPDFFEVKYFDSFAVPQSKDEYKEALNTAPGMDKPSGNRKEVLVQGFLGVERVLQDKIEKSEVLIQQRLFAIERRVYEVSVVRAKDRFSVKEASLFLESFKPQDVTLTGPFVAEEPKKVEPKKIDPKKKAK